jgi:hypothetical protein
MHEEIIAAHETDPQKVAQRCLDSIPAKKTHFYMKNMPHHMIDGFPLDWARHCTNIHLIRHPARVITSYGAKRTTMTFEDIGFPQQAALYGKIGGLVIDSADIRAEPEQMLKRLCDAIGLDFDPAMLKWPKGSCEADGVWAAHWYNAVHQSTGFADAEGPLPTVDEKHQQTLDAALPIYEKLLAKKL